MPGSLGSGITRRVEVELFGWMLSGQEVRDSPGDIEQESFMEWCTCGAPLNHLFIDKARHRCTSEVLLS